MPSYKFNLVCCLVALAAAASGSLTARAKTPDFSETWVEDPVYFGVDPPTPSLFAVNGELLWLHRTEADPDQHLVTRTLNLTVNGQPVSITREMLRMGDLNLPTEAGVRFSLLFGPPTGRYFELTYAGIFDQDATVTALPNNANQTDPIFFGLTYSLIDDPPLNPAILQHTVSYESDLHSLELNLWSDAEVWRLRPFVGARWIRQSETFRNFETQFPEFGGRADFLNNLFGLQSGFATVLWQRAEWFHVQAMAKAGVYRNTMDLDAVFNFAGVPVATLNRDENAISCSGQFDLTAVWQLTPYCNFHVGYTGLWLTEVGLVGNQNDNFDILTGTGDFDTGVLSYQGGHVGVTITW